MMEEVYTDLKDDTVEMEYKADRHGRYVESLVCAGARGTSVEVTSQI